MRKAVKRGPVPAKEASARGKASQADRKRLRAAYLRDIRERAEWGITMLRWCEAMGHPIVFRKSDLIALRK